MLLYNITTKIDHQAHKEWLEWVQHVYLPHVMESGYFDNYKLARLRGVDESDGITYAIQFAVPNQITFQLYQQKQALAHQTMHDTRYKNRFVSFRSVLEVITKG